MQAAQAHPDYAVFASRQLTAADPTLLDGDGDSYHVSGRAWRSGYGVPVATHRPTSLQVRPVFSPCGAAALYRRSAYVEVGGLDEDFFCYFEDVDLGFRLQLAGYPCLLVPQAVVHHVGSASTGGQHGDFAVYHGHRNLVWTYFKNMPGALLWLLLPLHLALNLITLLRYRHRIAVVWRAKKDALLGLPRMIEKRQSIQARRRASTAAVWRVLSKRLPHL